MPQAVEPVAVLLTDLRPRDNERLVRHPARVEIFEYREQVVTHPSRPEFQAMLDTVLARASDEQRNRFTASLDTAPTATAGGDDPTNRRQFLSGLALAPALAEIRPRRPASSLRIGQIDDFLAHLRDQWHLLVKTDNLFGPRYALRGVLDQIQLIEYLLLSVRGGARTEFVRIGAQYAESAAWLYEDSDDLPTARAWNSRAMEWAHESDDTLMLAWTLFRHSQQAISSGNGAEVVGLAQAAARDTDALPVTMRAAIAQQMAHGRAMQGEASEAQRLLDQSHEWAAVDEAGDARVGHGSFCTSSYIELQRASCWLTLGYADRAVTLYDEVLPTIPAVYRRDRGRALSRLAKAYAAIGQPGQAARVATDALAIARDAGSARTVVEVQAVAQALRPRQELPVVKQLLQDVATS